MFFEGGLGGRAVDDFVGLVDGLVFVGGRGFVDDGGGGGRDFLHPAL